MTDFLLLLAVFYIGTLINSPLKRDFNENTVYSIHSCCKEELPHQNYILSAYHQDFYLSNFYTDTSYHIGDSLIFYARICSLQQNSNPGEFSYTRYLKQKKVYYRLIPVSPIQQIGFSRNLHSVFNNFRNNLLNKTTALFQDTACRMLINALCLGYKNDIDSELQNVFITTGTIHLLSVSGLHTGAIYLLLLFVFRHLGLSGPKKELIILPILWSYACLTGLSPSVVRASTILSFIAIGKAFNRTNNPINSLAAAAFFTLLLQPNALYSLSFLLSYSAYAGILIIYPFLYHLPGHLPPIITQIYACICITISAQLPTLPISAFYFHTINISGFIANIIAVPLTTLLLYCSAICLFLPTILSQYLTFCPNLLCRGLIYFLTKFAPHSINIQNLYPSPLLVIFIYGCTILFGIYLLNSKRSWLYMTLCALSLFFTFLLINNRQLSTNQEIIIFQHYKQSSILLNYHGFYTFLKNTTQQQNLPYIQQNKLKPYPEHQGLIHPQFEWKAPLFYWQQDTILITDQTITTYSNCNILIITQNVSPQKIFAHSPPSSQPQKIIVDGSNSKYNALKWYEYCLCHHINFQNTSETGCVYLPLK